jgi:hypothetical protein
MGLPRIAVPEYSLILPSTGKEIKYRPFLVKEEKILLMAMESENSQEVITATTNVIKNCVFGEIDVDTLPTFDIEYIFLWLRGRAKGEKIELNYKCPKCEEQIPLSFNIEDVKIFRHEEHDPKIELTDNLGVMMKYPTMSLQAEIEKMSELPQVEQMFKTIRVCIDYIYDAEKMYASKDHTEQEMIDFLESLTDDQFQKISKFFETTPKLKHEVKLDCKNISKEAKGTKGKKKTICGYSEDLTLEGLQSFFE